MAQGHHLMGTLHTPSATPCAISYVFRKHMRGAAARLIERGRVLDEAYLSYCRIHGQEVDLSALQVVSCASVDPPRPSESPD